MFCSFEEFWYQDVTSTECFHVELEVFSSYFLSGMFCSFEEFYYQEMYSAECLHVELEIFSSYFQLTFGFQNFVVASLGCSAVLKNSGVRM